MSYQEHPWQGVFAATLCAFKQNEDIDEEGLRVYFSWLCSIPGLKGLVCNGHTGEIMALRENERARVTTILREEIETSQAKIKAISGISAEGSLVAIDHALAAKEAGADAILLMPPHYQLRFGRTSETAENSFRMWQKGPGLTSSFINTRLGPKSDIPWRKCWSW